MNKYKEPAVYALTHDGGFFYVGYTSSNALNRWWQHRSRAKAGHEAPVYEWMRSVGIETVGWIILEKVPDGADPFIIEAKWINKLISEDHDLQNQLARDGLPNSISPEMASRMGQKLKGKPSWVAGLRGEEAGWNDERREKHRSTVHRKRVQKEIDEPSLLFQRMDKVEKQSVRAIQASMTRPIPERAKRSPNRTDEHGTRGMYEKNGCRCDPCRDNMARHNARKRGKPDWATVKAGPVKLPIG